VLFRALPAAIGVGVEGGVSLPRPGPPALSIRVAVAILGTIVIFSPRPGPSILLVSVGVVSP
jgi:hypothetical protein